MSLYKESDEEIDKTRADHIEARWKQLHELEMLRSEAALRYLFLVSGGSAAATLTYIGNLTKDGTSVSAAAFWMLGCFASALLCVGLLKISLTYHVVAIFACWRVQVENYYQNKTTWQDVLANDENVVKRNEWRTHVLGWLTFGLLTVGMFIGFINLQQESNRVKTEKSSRQTDITASDKTGTAGESNSKRPLESTKNDGRSSTEQPATAPAEKIKPKTPAAIPLPTKEKASTR